MSLNNHFPPPEIINETSEITVVKAGETTISVIHEMTLGDILIITLITAILIFKVLSRFIRS